MAKFRQGISKDQLIMFPQSLDEYVGEEDVCRYVESLVEEFDLSSIESKYSDIGRRAYSPSMLVTASSPACNSIYRQSVIEIIATL